MRRICVRPPPPSVSARCPQEARTPPSSSASSPEPIPSTNAYVSAHPSALSTRGLAGKDSDTLIGGFILRGTAPRNVIVRGVGPALGASGVAGVLANPVVTLFDSGGNRLATNDDWGTNANKAAIVAATASAGLSPLAENSRDAALLLTLAPGAYTAHVTSVDNSTGVALVEVYEVP